MLKLADDHELFTNESDQCKRLNIGKKKRFTITEGLKMFTIIGTNTSQNLQKSQFWQKVAEQGKLPERTADQLKKFWLTYKEMTPETWLAQAIHEKVDFSFSIHKIPSDDFLVNFRQKYELEFIRLESMDPRQ